MRKVSRKYLEDLLMEFEIDFTEIDNLEISLDNYLVPFGNLPRLKVVAELRPDPLGDVLHHTMWAELVRGEV